MSGGEKIDFDEWREMRMEGRGEMREEEKTWRVEGGRQTGLDERIREWKKKM